MIIYCKVEQRGWLRPGQPPAMATLGQRMSASVLSCLCPLCWRRAADWLTDRNAELVCLTGWLFGKEKTNAW